MRGADAGWAQRDQLEQLSVEVVGTRSCRSSLKLHNDILSETRLSGGMGPEKGIAKNPERLIENLRRKLAAEGAEQGLGLGLDHRGVTTRCDTLQ